MTMSQPLLLAPLIFTLESLAGSGGVPRGWPLTVSMNMSPSMTPTSSCEVLVG